MRLADMVDLICAKLLLNEDQLSRDAIRDFLKARYNLLWNSYLWKDSVVVYHDLPVPVDPATGDYTPDMVLPESAAHAIAVFEPTRERTLSVGTLTELARSGAISQVAGLWQFMDVSATGLPFPTTATKLRIKFAAGPDDLGASARLALGGELDEASWAGIPNDPFKESFNITVPFTTANWYDVGYKVAQMTKPVTVRYVTCTVQDVAGVFPEKSWYWPESSTLSLYARIRLVDRPNIKRDGPDLRVSILCKRKPRPFYDDADSPALRGCEQTLLALATGDALERERMYTKAAAKFAEAASLLEVMKDGERNQSAYVSRVTPEVAMDAGSRNDFGW
jgi:hypothetical protein